MKFNQKVYELKKLIYEKNKNIDAPSMILTLIMENNSFNDQDMLGDMLMRQYKMTQAHGEKLVLAVKKSYAVRPMTAMHSTTKPSLMNKKSQKILKDAGIEYNGNFQDRLCPKGKKTVDGQD